MYHFAIIALMALATVKLVDFAVANLPGADRLRSLLTFIVAIGAVWVLDYSMFAGFAVDIRNATAGVWATGFVVAGMTVPWRALFGFLTHDKATSDESLGRPTPIRRAA